MMQLETDATGIDEIKIPEDIPILPGKDTIVFPSMLVPIVVSMEKWTSLIEEVAVNQRLIGLFAESHPDGQVEDNLFEIGTVVRVVRALRISEGNGHVLLQGIARARLVRLERTEPHPKGRIQVIRDRVRKTVELSAMQRNLLSLFQKAVALSPNLPAEMAITAAGIQEPGRLADFVASALDLSLADRQDVLETIDVVERLQHVTSLTMRELEILEIGSRIQEQMRQQLEKTQKEFYLREQMKAIQKELGEVDERQSEVNELKGAIEAAKLPPEASREAARELDRLARTSPASPEYSMVRTYLDWMSALPWTLSTKDRLDIKLAADVLDEDHYDLEKVKERILEYLAVRKLKGGVMKGPILCFVGPPGVGKTSLGQSIARALERKFVRLSLGGIRDEAEIRGHRRTYVGAMPGRILQGLRRAESNNPVFMLDEVDKLAVGLQGDPAAALLEVLDPAQNSAFVDNYLGVPFDLSQVMFIATANVLDPIPPALRDRMEVLELPGYTEVEKLEIARRFLVPKQLEENGLSPERLTFTSEALRVVIRSYTREAGVRNLERTIATICRKVAKKAAEEDNLQITVTPDALHQYLGPRQFRFEVIEERDEVGVATGLAWTPAGGDVLFVEASIVPGKGSLTLTGQLGDVMQESAKAALTYARSRAATLGVREDFYSRYDIHIHVPSGAIPKDGPSAGVTMAVAVASALSKHPVKKEVAMTGEITLRGKVLPVGGIKEKVLAAHRAGVRVVVMPKDNEKDLGEVSEEVKRELDFVFVDHIDGVLKVALQTGKEMPVPAKSAVEDNESERHSFAESNRSSRQGQSAKLGRGGYPGRHARSHSCAPGQGGSARG